MLAVLATFEVYENRLTIPSQRVAGRLQEYHNWLAGTLPGGLFCEKRENTAKFERGTGGSSGSVSTGFP
jgi:hypothetical protein